MRMKIALCDDDARALPVISGAARSAFSAKGVDPDIREFSSGRELLTALETTHFQLLLLDIEMPGIDGITLGKKLRAMGDDTKIVYVSEAESRVFESFQVQPLGFVVPLPVTSPDSLPPLYILIIRELPSPHSTVPASSVSQRLTVRIPDGQPDAGIAEASLC